MFTPVLKIGGHWKEPAHPGLQLDLTGEAFLRLAKTTPGELTNLVLNPLSKDTQFIEDPLAGQTPFRPREISPTYTPNWIDTSIKGAMAWVQIPQIEELEQRRLSRATLAAQLGELATKAQTTAPEIIAMASALGGETAEAAQEQWNQVLAKLSVRERQIAAGLCVLLQELNERSTGFLEDVPNLFGTETAGIRWNFAVPNVDKILISSWELQADQTQIIRFKRMSPLPDQNPHENDFSILIGNGYTQYGLVFSKDEAIEFRHYKNMKPSERTRLETKLRDTLRTGYLTTANIVQINEWKTQIDFIKKAAKATGGKPAGANAQQIENLKRQITTLQNSKRGLTDAMQKQRNATEAKLYYAKVPIGLSEDARSLFNQEVTVALRFHRKGFVSIRVGLGAQPGKEAFYYEIEGVTKTARPHRILPAGSHILIRSDGGPFGLVYGVADFAALGTLYTQPFEIPFDFDADEWKFNFDAIGLRDADADTYASAASDPEDAAFDPALVRLPRARIEGRMELVNAGFSNLYTTIPTRVRACVDFISEPNLNDKSAYKGNRDYGAELYRATLTCIAGAPEPSDEIIWDSRDKYPIEDIQLNSTGEGAQLHEVFLDDSTRRAIDLPVDLSNRYCEFGLIDTRPGASHGQYIPLVRGGTIVDPSRDNIRFWARGGVMAVATRPGTGAHLFVQGMETRFDRLIQVPLVGNGARANDYLRDLALVHGIGAEFLGGIPTGNVAGIGRIDPPRVGHYPDVKPNVGDSLWPYMLEIVAKHIPGWRLRMDAVLGATLERVAWRDRRDIHYRTTLPYADICSVHRDPGGGNGLLLRQDVSEYTTEATFVGAYNAGRGKRHSATHRIWEATHRRGSAYFIGEPRPYRAAPDESLRSKAACERALRQWMMLHGLPPYAVEWESWYQPDLWEGDLILIDNIAVVMRKISYTRFAKGMEQKAHLTARLYDDVTVPITEGN